MVMMGCNSGGVKGEGTGGDGRGLNEVVSSARQVFLETFLSFSDLLKGAFGITADTTKEAVGERLGEIGEAVNVAKSKLESLKIVDNYNLIKDKADGVITKMIGILEKLVNGSNKIKEATKDASGKIANADNAGDAVQADTESVKGLVEGISMIYEAIRDAKIDLGGNAVKVIADSKAISKLFNATGNASADGLKAANVALNASSGADILAAIEASRRGVGKSAGQIKDATNAYDIAVATKDDTDAHNDISTKGPVIAAGIALRAMAKSGKLATKAADAPQEGINAVLSRAVSKTVNEMMLNIRKTVDK
ncbi:Variable major outer membrane lipoprotein, partial [Borrelia duttonii CR2A]